VNFDFSDEQNSLRGEVRRALAPFAGAARQALTDKAKAQSQLWRHAAELGWLGAALPEAVGGAGLSPLELCILAEEFGRILAPIPFSSTMAAAECLSQSDPAGLQHWGPQIAAGEAVGCLAFWERSGPLSENHIQCRLEQGRLYGRKSPVLDGADARFALVLARESGGIRLVWADLAQQGVERTSLDLFDPTRNAAELRFDGASAQIIGAPDEGWGLGQGVLDRLAVLLAFEQVGAAQTALDTAVAYAKQRHAFSRPIGSYQAIKHKLADVYVALEVARSHALYGAWAFSAGAAELPLAAAAARVAASQACTLAAEESLQTHGGIGYTWDNDCHLYYRRAKFLALQAGGPDEWRERLVAALDRRNQA